ncbi:MAG: hypothetical protein QF464_17415, partial [Myxococcota bacterium]|nr:hypothetical protein [Myxococcota bacterium]
FTTVGISGPLMTWTSDEVAAEYRWADGQDLALGGSLAVSSSKMRMTLSDDDTRCVRPVRRYRAEVSGSLIVSVQMWQASGSAVGAQGAQLEIYHSGELQDTITVRATATESAPDAHTFIISDVDAGSDIDFVLGPVSADNGGANGGDLIEVDIQIHRTVETMEAVSLGTNGTNVRTPIDITQPFTVCHQPSSDCDAHTTCADDGAGVNGANYMCSCTPDCTDKLCGPDGCGGNCGTCPVGVRCQTDDTCGCTPDCDGKNCGSDGCDGSCGDCAFGTICSEVGTCEMATPNCSGVSTQLAAVDAADLSGRAAVVVWMDDTPPKLYKQGQGTGLIKEGGTVCLTLPVEPAAQAADKVVGVVAVLAEGVESILDGEVADDDVSKIALWATDHYIVWYPDETVPAVYEWLPTNFEPKDGYQCGRCDDNGGITTTTQSCGAPSITVGNQAAVCNWW